MDGRTDRRRDKTLFHRTFLATAKGPILQTKKAREYLNPEENPSKQAQTPVPPNINLIFK